MEGGRGHISGTAGIRRRLTARAVRNGIRCAVSVMGTKRVCDCVIAEATKLRKVSQERASTSVVRTLLEARDSVE